MTDEPEHTIKLIRKELDNGLAVQFFFEGIAPIIAEKLGDSWKQDTMTFSEVTIAVSKLRLLCQELESLYLEPENTLKSAPKILLFTLEGENHTFGSYLAALKLKKENFNAQIAIGYSESDLFKLLEFGNFQLIGVSIGSENMVNQSNEGHSSKLRRTYVRHYLTKESFRNTGWDRHPSHNERHDKTTR